jgi:hypothetical protein
MMGEEWKGFGSKGKVKKVAILGSVFPVGMTGYISKIF